MAVQENMFGGGGGVLLVMVLVVNFHFGNMLMFVVTLLKQLQNKTFHILFF